MKKYLKKKSFIISALIFLIACLISGILVYLNLKKENQSALAAPICGDNNIAGFAWSDNIGWVSFNSGDCENNSLLLKLTKDFETSSIEYASATTLENNGNILIAYRDIGNSGYGTFVVYNSLGNEIKPPTVFESTDTRAISTAFLGNDKVLIAYLAYGNSRYGTFVIYDSTTNSVGSPIEFSSVETGSISTIILSDSNVLIAYENLNDSGNGYFKIYNSQGSQVLGPIEFEPTRSALAISATTLNNGNVLIAYGTITSPYGGYFVIYNPSTGNQVLGPTLFDSINGQIENISAVTLTNGDVSVSYWSVGDDYVYLITLDENGNPLHLKTQISGQYSFSYSDTSIALSDNTVFIPYYDNDLSSDSYVIYNSNGEKVKSATAFNEDVLDVALLSDGNIFFVNPRPVGGFTILEKIECGADYGVKIDWPTGNFSGYAWSPNIGWVSFNRKTCNSGADNGEGCAQDSDCNGSVPCELTGPGATGVPPEAPYGTDDYIAKYDSGADDVTGWAKALSLGEDGWIKLSDASSWNNGVIINGTSKEFEGWAWNGNDVANTGIGWLSFNCSNTGTCGVSDYKVYIANTAPEARDLKAPNITYAQACSSRDARRVQLTWEFDDPDVAACGDYESAYQIIVDTVNYTTQTELEALVDNGRGDGWPYKTPKTSVPSPPTPVESFFPTNNTIHRNAALDYDTQYYWWVKVWDKYSADSGWVQYDSLTDTDNDDGNLLTFTTYKHEFPEFPQTPNPPFSWFPLEPSKEEKILFSAEGSKYYTVSDPSNPALCSDGVVCGYLWTVTPLGTADIDDNIAYSPNITFHEAKTSQPVTLKVTDAENYWCEASYDFFPLIKLPTWKEVKYR